MTSDLLSSLIRMGLYILAPWLLLFQKEKLSGCERELVSHPLEFSEKKKHIPVHALSFPTEELEEEETTSIEIWSFLSEALTVLWLATTAFVRQTCSEIKLRLKYKSNMDSQPPHNLHDLNSEEREVIKNFANSSPVVDALLNRACPSSSRVREAVPDLFLLQFATLANDVGAQKCIQKLGDTYAPGGKHGLFGAFERPDWKVQTWEKRVHKQKATVSFSMERKYLRNGLFLYRTVTVFKNANLEEFRRFVLNTSNRKDWDWSSIDFRTLQTQTESRELPSDSESCFIFSENKMPGPLSNREYCMARRVWDRSDGGCYSISKSAIHPCAPQRRGRNVRVEDYTSAFEIRPLQMVDGERMEAVEMTSLYFDNPKMRPMALNLAMNASMWTGIVVTDTGFREYLSKLHPSRKREEFRKVAEVPRESQQLLTRQKNPPFLRLMLIVIGIGCGLIGKEQLRRKND